VIHLENEKEQAAKKDLRLPLDYSGNPECGPKEIDLLSLILKSFHHDSRAFLQRDLILELYRKHHWS
jgi:hypothetical protein